MKKAQAYFFALAIALGSYTITYAQTSTLEICDGIDNNGDGTIDEGLNCQQHYLGYRLQPINFQPVSVFLSDQFSKTFVQYKVERPVALLNPTRKRHNNVIFPIIRPKLHYIAYRVTPSLSFMGTTVQINNQFEQSTIKVLPDDPTAQSTRLLLTPAAKKENTSLVGIKNFKIPVADHFLCYEVEPKQFTIPVLLKDQFQGRNFQVVERTRLCNPVAKEHSGGVFPIQKPEEHLTCYRVIDPIQTSRSVLVRDQFLGLKQATAVEERELCVPTQKKELH